VLLILQLVPCFFLPFFQSPILVETQSRAFSLDLLRWGRSSEMGANFILGKANFAVECGRFG
jgi:hypothetical protein